MKTVASVFDGLTSIGDCVNMPRPNTFGPCSFSSSSVQRRVFSQLRNASRVFSKSSSVASSASLGRSLGRRLATAFICGVVSPVSQGDLPSQWSERARSNPAYSSKVAPKVASSLGCVTDLGVTYAMEDTDSMAIVATRRGGLIECEGGPHRKTGKPAIKALSWAQVAAIAKRFEALNPYDLKGSVLKIEEDNFDPKTERQRQLWCLAISAKRYTLFLRDNDGEPALLREGINNTEDRYSEHGLGHLLNPADPESEDRNWIAQAWLSIVRRSLGLPTKPLRFAKRVAVGRITVSSPAVMKPLQKLNAGKPYEKQIKPFNFILSCHVRKLGHPIGADPERFHLIAPYETDPRKWEVMQWIDQYSKDGKRYRISASAAHGSPTMAAVKSYGSVLREYEYHPEAKCADASGAPCKKRTTGLLGRRHVEIDGFAYIGKESNKLQEVEEGGVPSESDVYTVFVDARRDEWAVKWLPILKAMPMAELMEGSGLSRRALYTIRAGRRPRLENAAILKSIAKEQGK